MRLLSRVDFHVRRQVVRLDEALAAYVALCRIKRTLNAIKKSSNRRRLTVRLLPRMDLQMNVEIADGREELVAHQALVLLLHRLPVAQHRAGRGAGGLDVDGRSRRRHRRLRVQIVGLGRFRNHVRVHLRHQLDGLRVQLVLDGAVEKRVGEAGFLVHRRDDHRCMLLLLDVILHRVLLYHLHHIRLLLITLLDLNVLDHRVGDVEVGDRRGVLGKRFYHVGDELGLDGLEVFLDFHSGGRKLILVLDGL